MEEVISEFESLCKSHKTLEAVIKTIRSKSIVLK